MLETIQKEAAWRNTCAGCSYAPDYDDETFYCLPGDCTGYFDEDMRHCEARDAPALPDP